MLASDPMLTTWYYVFNYHPSIIINKDKIINELISIGKFSKWKGIRQIPSNAMLIALREHTLSQIKKGNLQKIVLNVL